MKRGPLIASFSLFLALCISAAYWTMQLYKPPSRPVAAPVQPQKVPPASLEAAASLFGGKRTVAISSNFQLKGVVVADKAAESVAILVANGKPAQAYRAKAEVAPGVRIEEIQQTYVLLSERGAVKRIELPEDARKRAKAVISTTASGIK